MKRYRPEEISVDQVSMTDLETYYNTFLVSKNRKLWVSMRAPLLVCMALHGEQSKIIQLMRKFPLIDSSGWTPELEKEEEIQHKCLVMAQKGQSEELITRNGIISTTFAFALSDCDDPGLFRKLWLENPLSHQEMDWIHDCNQYSAYKLAYMLQK